MLLVALLLAEWILIQLPDHHVVLWHPSERHSSILSRESLWLAKCPCSGWVRASPWSFQCWAWKTQILFTDLQLTMPPTGPLALNVFPLRAQRPGTKVGKLSLSRPEPPMWEGGRGFDLLFQFSALPHHSFLSLPSFHSMWGRGADAGFYVPHRGDTPPAPSGTSELWDCVWTEMPQEDRKSPPPRLESPQLWPWPWGFLWPEPQEHCG